MSPLIMLSLYNRQRESTGIIKLMVWLFVCVLFFSFYYIFSPPSQTV